MIVNLIFVFSTFDLVELGYLAKGGFQIRITSNNKELNKFVISIKTDQRRWKAIFINFVDSYTLTLIPPIDDFLRLLTFTSAVILHDAVYQFLRIFYYSRFKPPSLRNDFDVISWLITDESSETPKKSQKSITPAQFAMPIIEVVLVLGPIFTTVTQFKQIISSERLKQSSTIQFIAPAYLGSASIFLGTPGKIDHACRYLLKTARLVYLWSFPIYFR